MVCQMFSFLHAFCPILLEEVKTEKRDVTRPTSICVQRNIQQRRQSFHFLLFLSPLPCCSNCSSTPLCRRCQPCSNHLLLSPAFTQYAVLLFPFPFFLLSQHRQWVWLFGSQMASVSGGANPAFSALSTQYFSRFLPASPFPQTRREAHISRRFPPFPARVSRRIFGCGNGKYGFPAIGSKRPPPRCRHRLVAEQDDAFLLNERAGFGRHRQVEIRSGCRPRLPASPGRAGRSGR
jgi:hypothetical protein